MTATVTERITPTEVSPIKKSGLLLTAAIVALVVGFGSVAGGLFGVWYTWDQAVEQGVVTPDDAVIPETPVRGPFTMWAQADIITKHQLERTGGLYYSEMPREVPAVDEAGQPILDENGEQVMVPNEARASWIDATTLTTALSLGIISYALSAMAIAVGAALILTGFVFLRIRNKAVLV
ncbi:MAG TPA: hypothetical protein VF377_14505 [Acidimicrobiia bacterium]|jgi:hypothetical protein